MDWWKHTKVDGRTREGEAMREIAEALRAHVGEPSIPEAMLIVVHHLIQKDKGLRPRGAGDSSPRARKGGLLSSAVIPKSLIKRDQ